MDTGLQRHTNEDTQFYVKKKHLAPPTRIERVTSPLGGII